MIYKPGIRCYEGYKLNTNENFFSISKNVYFLLKIISYNYEKLKFYPDSNNTYLCNIIKNIYKIEKKNIFISNGSDESLFFIFYLLKNFKFKLPKISYPFYNVYSNFNKIKKKNIYFKKLLKFNFFFISSPNSPTGEFFKKKKILKKNLKKIFIIDEAYNEFYNFGYKKHINLNNNLIIINTLSKAFSAAGIRIGILFSNEKIIKKIKIIKQCFNSYNTNTISNYLSIECLKDINYLFLKIQKNNFLKLLFNNIFIQNNNNGNFIFIKKKLDFYFFFKKKKFYFRFFKKYIRITILNFKILKLIFFLLLIWS